MSQAFLVHSSHTNAIVLDGCCGIEDQFMEQLYKGGSVSLVLCDLICSIKAAIEIASGCFHCWLPFNLTNLMKERLIKMLHHLSKMPWSILCALGFLEMNSFYLGKMYCLNIMFELAGFIMLLSRIQKLTFGCCINIVEVPFLTYVVTLEGMTFWVEAKNAEFKWCFKRTIPPKTRIDVPMRVKSNDLSNSVLCVDIDWKDEGSLSENMFC